MARFRLAELALEDLAKVHGYIAKQNVAAADRLLSTFFETFAVLSAHPELGTARHEYRDRELRSFSVGNYVIFYRMVDSIVEVARVLHGARDIDTLFG